MDTIQIENKTVGEIVAQNPKAASVFRKLNIDFCCGGKTNFVDACEKKQQDPYAVWEEIENIGQSDYLHKKNILIDDITDKNIKTK